MSATKQCSVGRILFTGGGTGGHVLPCVPIIRCFKQKGWQVSYIGSNTGLEKSLLSEQDLSYYGISTGKLRRYFSFKNLTDIFRILYGLIQAFFILGKEKPDVVFSKGGYVSLPVVVSAWLRRIPVLAHESDVTPGLANRLALPFVDAVCVNFENTVLKKSVYTGTPVRESLLTGSREVGRRLAGITGVDEQDSKRKVLLVVGGSLGAEIINRVVRSSLAALLQHFQVVHICGAGKRLTQLSEAASGPNGYVQFEFVDAGWGDLLAAADVVVSRAGANAVYELLLLGIPNLLVPLSRAASRGDQIVNAALVEKQGYSLVLQEEALSDDSLLEKLDYMLKHLETYQKQLDAFKAPDSLGLIVTLLENLVSKTRSI